jgi:carbon storage regulator
VLVLSRKTDEVITIGEGANAIRITIIEIRGDKCRIGIDAPKNVPVMRAELGEKHNALPD